MKPSFLLPFGLAVLLTSCDSRQEQFSTESRGVAAPPYEVQRGSDSYDRGSSRQRQAAFLNRIRQSDPRFETIQRAVLNENNELGLVLGHNVEMDSIPRLMRTMLTEMAKEFPGQDLTVIAYAPTQPPTKIGTARLDAQTRQMTYTAAQR
ncbi:MAG TPA: hypothetical protein VJ063_14015 [Verrucomicrobiae bacterium]|nr:hypothetical protein [Verrucomicrobiae bacterium]